MAGSSVSLLDFVDADGGWRRYGLGGVYEHGTAQVSFGYVREVGKTSDADSDSFELGVAFSLGAGVFAKGSVRVSTRS